MYIHRSTRNFSRGWCYLSVLRPLQTDENYGAKYFQASSPKKAISSEHSPRETRQVFCEYRFPRINFDFRHSENFFGERHQIGLTTILNVYLGSGWEFPWHVHISTFTYMMSTCAHRCLYGDTFTLSHQLNYVFYICTKSNTYILNW